MISVFSWQEAVGGCYTGQIKFTLVWYWNTNLLSCFQLYFNTRRVQKMQTSVNHEPLYKCTLLRL